MVETVWCTQCGAVVPSTDRFCLQCGAENVEFDDTQTTSDDTQTIPVPNGRHDHSRRSLLVAFVVTAVLIVAFAGIGIHRLTSPSRASEAVGSASVPASPQRTVATSTPATTTIPVEPAPSSAPATTQAPTQAPGPELEALAALNEQRAADLPTTPLDGQWVAQLSSKYDGIYDPLQTSASGSHTFHNVDILAEYQHLQGLDLGGAPLTLLLSTDYGQKQTVSGQALWVTFALPGLNSASEVQSWCSTYFAPLTGPALADTCTPTQLYPPS